MRKFPLFMAVLTLAAWNGQGLAEAPPRPKLAVVVLVDQLRGDMLPQLHGRLAQGGFSRFLDEGVFYANAEYQHSTTFTAVGHASLATGGNAPEHGIVGNQWRDVETGEVMYCVADAEHRYLGVEGTPPGAGTSPHNLLSSTVADELVLETGNRGRAFAVSLKDRAAILSAGRLGKAFWFNRSIGHFISSTYYFEELPQWVVQWNDASPGLEYRGRVWELLHPRETYTFAGQDGREDKISYQSLGTDFHHSLGQVPPDFLHTALYFTPFGDELAVDFAKKLVTEERLGQGDHPDMLVLALSTQDYIGHAFGPNSLQAEDNLLQLDTILARFFQFLDAQVGRENLLLVLSSDHGIHDIPEYMVEKGFPGGRIDVEGLLQHGERALQAHYKTDKKFLIGFENPCLYLNLETVRGLGLNREEVEAVLAEAVRNFPGIALAVSASDLAKNRLMDTPLHRKIARSHHPERSGHVFIVEKPFWYLYHDMGGYAAMHGSPYPYDTHVPVAFSGMGIQPRWVWDAVAPESIAPTLAAFLRIKRPSGSVAPLFTEVLNR